MNAASERAVINTAASTPKRRTALRWLIALLIMAALPWLAVNNYQHFLLNLILINVILAIGLNVVKGFAGQVTVGHVALMAVGAYASAVLSVKFGLPFWFALPAGVLIAAAAGLLVAVPSLRLEGAYLALATLGLAESVRIFISATDYVGAAVGMSDIPAPRVAGFVFDTHLRYYYIVMPVAMLAIYLSLQMLRSSVGRAFMAVREDPLAAEASGVNVRMYKSLAFCISAVYAGVAGGLMAHMTPGFIHPNNYTMVEMVTVLLMVILGGIGHIWGGIVGAVVVTIIYDLTRDYYQVQLLLFGSVIVLTVMFMPTGIGGLIDRRISTRRFVALRNAASNSKAGKDAA